MANTTDVDNAREDLIVGEVTVDPAAGTVTFNEDTNEWTFVPAANFNGDVTFNYTVSDGVADPVAATATLVVENDYADLTIGSEAPTPAVEAKAQITTITLAGTVGDIADTYTVTIGGETFTYETTGAETDISDIANALQLAVVSADGYEEGPYVATYVDNVITLTAKEAGEGFTVESSGTNAVVGQKISDIDLEEVVENVEFVAAQAQVSSVTFEAQTIELGDTFSVSINGIVVSYEANGYETSVDDIARALSDLININADLNSVVTSARRRQRSYHHCR